MFHTAEDIKVQNNPKYNNFLQKERNKQFSIYSGHPKIYQTYIARSHKDNRYDELKHFRHLYHKYEILVEDKRKKRLEKRYPKLVHSNKYKKQDKTHKRMSNKEKEQIIGYKKSQKENRTKYSTTSFHLDIRNKSKTQHPINKNVNNNAKFANKVYFAKVTEYKKDNRSTTRSNNVIKNKYARQLIKDTLANHLFLQKHLNKKNKPKKKSKLKHLKKDELIKQITAVSSYSSEEEELKLNLKDALFHGNKKIMKSRRHVANSEQSDKKIDIHLSSSATDDEQTLKSNIYKYFEFNKNH